MKKTILLIIAIIIVVGAIGGGYYWLSLTTKKSVISAQMKANDTKRKSDLRSIQNALEVYYDKNGFYPKVQDYNSLVQELVDNKIIGKLIQDPLYPSQRYHYGLSNDGQVYRLEAILEYTKDKGGVDNTLYQVDNMGGTSGLKVTCMDNCTFEQNSIPGWQTYMIKEYDFNIQFSNDWVKAEEIIPGTIEFKVKNRIADDSLGSDFKIYKLDKPKGQTLQQYFDNLHDLTCKDSTMPLGCSPKLDISKWEKMKIDGKDAVFQKMTIYGGQEYYIYIDLENYFLVFRGIDLGALDNFEQYFKDILKTVVFSE